MRVGTPGFVPERLIEARAARRILSKKALATLISVNPSTVTRWEDGTSAPDADALAELAAHLHVRREFFLRPVANSDRPLFYRTLASTLVKDLNYQESQMHWLQEISSIVEHYVDFPEVDIPDVLQGASYKQLRDEDIELIASDLRTHWSVGDGPCIDMMPLLERVGCIVGSIEMGTSKLDGLCSWAQGGNRPHILLSTDKMSFPRRQMDAAHELGHAILHRHVTEEELKKDLKEIERQAFRFASAFLMPATTYSYEVKSASLASLLSLKERWRVSVKAQIRRLSDLDIIPADHATSLYKLYSAKGWSREEPLDKNWPISEPTVLANALQLIVDSAVRSKSDLLSVEFTMKAGDIENLTALPPGWFSRNAEVIGLKLREAVTDRTTGDASTILPFPSRKG
ncbi:XRE family transcriptional regulator [Rhizobium leguminosarum]|uniref:XRE family transcriptional regulator n=1 Tax=Rhizobium leguminosarum TaxID=384 RepID=UPI001441A5A2|nr:XRE family transcriptional regulator [Rhizobium leguminosarum]NKL59721.1 ImmA/IrrE family metallo-endopeptidase [Rhizobium leguminosarum bv. viciae]